MGGTLTCTVSLPVTSFAEQMEFMYFSYGVIFGIGLSGISLVGFIVITKYFTKWRSFAISVVSAGMGAGSLIFGPLLELLLSSLGWRWTFRVLAAIACVNVFLVCALEPNYVQADEPNRRCDTQENKQQRKMFYCSAWKNQRFVLVAAGAGMVLFATYIIVAQLVRLYLLVNICNSYMTCNRVSANSIITLKLDYCYAIHCFLPGYILKSSVQRANVGSKVYDSCKQI